jgi:lysophospholipase L1-like esterase
MKKATCYAITLLTSLVLMTSSYAQEKRILVYGDSNSWGWKPVIDGFPVQRYSDNVRWPGIMQKQLGSGYTVVVDGLSGRTVDVSYPQKTATLEGAEFNGELQLRISLAKNAPIDMVVFMLGTNDLRNDLNRTPEQIAAGISKLVDIARKDYGGVFTTYSKPEVLVISPPPIGDVSKTPIKNFFANAGAKSTQLATAFKQQGQLGGYAVIDSSQFIPAIQGIDGIHFTTLEHKMLGMGVTKMIKPVLNQKRY